MTDLLRECDYGAYEGRTTGEILAERPEWDVFRDGCPGGERPAQVAERMLELLHRMEPVRGDVLLFGHGHALRALAVCCLGTPLSFAGLLRLDAGTLSILGHERDHRAITLWNEAATSRDP